MYYGKLFRRIADSLRELADDMRSGINKIEQRIQENKDAIDAASARENQNSQIMQEMAKDFFAANQIAEGDKKTRDDKNYRVQNSIRWATWIAAIGAIFYGGVATYQANEMRKATNATRDSVRDYEASQAAQVVIEDFKIEGFPETAKETFSVVNHGPTIAHEVTVVDGGRGGTPNPKVTFPELGMLTKNLAPIPPVPAGFSLGPGERRTYEFEQGAMDKRMESYFFIKIGYRNIFGGVGHDSACLFYRPPVMNWFPCKEMGDYEAIQPQDK